MPWLMALRVVSLPATTSSRMKEPNSSVESRWPSTSAHEFTGDVVPWNGTIAYANMTSAGYLAFNWAKGAALDIDLPAFEGATGTVHITGTVACTSLYNR
jgi:hypothetical protein